MESQTQRKPRILCLHGFRTSGEILRNWQEDCPKPCSKSHEDFTEYTNFEECLAYMEDYMLKHGPFDGVLGFSMGGMIAALLPAMQEQGLALTKLAANAFSSPINCPSLHFIGEKDFNRQDGTTLLESFVDPVVIHHTKGHTIPKLDEKAEETMVKFIEQIQMVPLHEE
ncbi:hypothetical protein SLA2020_453630 [Shorea laevis]